MSGPATPSLKRELTRRLIVLQAALLALLVALVIGTLWASGYLIASRDEDHAIEVVGQALARGPDGGLVLRATPALAKLRSEQTDLWFVVRDDRRQILTEGTVPGPFAHIGDALQDVSQGRLGWSIGDDPARPAARFKRVTSAAGPVQVLTATQGPMSAAKAITAALLLLGAVGLPNLLLMTLATAVATPIVVRRALAGLSEAAAQAARVDAERRGARLSLTRIPAEIAPLVSAVNGALRRLDHGYERSKRFLIDAAHEIRTPIAILQVRLHALADGPEKARLVEDVARLATLAEQLLDLQRLDLHPESMSRVNLVEVGRRVVSDLAPLAIAAGYDIAFACEVDEVGVEGDPVALERALINLVQNAIAHGGRRGSITVSIEQRGLVAVSDEGPGIALADRERIFEPFHRLRSAPAGLGLGLNIVREIVFRHHGRIVVRDNPVKGTRFEMTFPVV